MTGVNLGNGDGGGRAEKSKHSAPPDGMDLRDSAWHHRKFTEFVRLKRLVGEPSPHLAIVGWLSRNSGTTDRLWLLGCYAATYCLPTAQVIWGTWGWMRANNRPGELLVWLTDNWKGIVTRTERRCVRTPKNMARCLGSYLGWMRGEYARLRDLSSTVSGRDYYDEVWKSVQGIMFFGRYINIRLVEGLRRFCGIPARLYDVRSIGGWSPKKALCYLYPEHAASLLTDDRAGNELTDRLAYDLLGRMRETLPGVDEYVLAAMLCEYKGAFEKRHQYPGWTLDQEPLLYDKVRAYWGDSVDLSGLWEARRALFPPEVLGEVGGRWHGTRWNAAAVLRDHGYNWCDLEHDYPASVLRSENLSAPVRTDDTTTRR